jgi:hypothetical protein
MEGTHVKPLRLLWLVTAVVVAGCGSTGSRTAVSTRVIAQTQTRTTTVVVFPAKRLSTLLPPLPDPTNCGEGMRSNGACFPELVAAFKQLWNESGVPPGKLTVDGTTASCTGYAHDAWLCKTNNQGDPLVYTAFAYGGPGGPDAAPLKVTTGPSQPPLPSPTPTPTPTPSSPPPNSQSFSGNGGENIGTVSLSADSTVHWTNDGDLFQTIDFGINSQGTSGTSALAAGTYRNVEVNALGNWTLRIVPNS